MPASQLFLTDRSVADDFDGQTVQAPLTVSSLELCFPVLSSDSQHMPWEIAERPGNMTLSSAGQSDDTTSSLGDSAYDILGDSTILTSDDEDRDEGTDSLASVDPIGPDDVVSMADTEGSGDLDSNSSRANSPQLHPSKTAAGCLGYHDLAMPMIDSETLPSSIEFEEPPHWGVEQVAVMHTICHLSEQRSAEILRTLQVDSAPLRLIATIRQTMTKEGLHLEEPFRLLYIGDPSARQVICEKLGAALAVSEPSDSSATVTQQRSSRFNVVPVSFGDKQSPEVELIDSFGHELIVDDCTFARVHKTQNQPDRLSLQLNGHHWYTSTWNGKTYTLSHSKSWKLPHIAIFFAREDDSLAMRQTRLYARSFMHRHAVPSIVISQHTFSENSSEKYTLDHRSVHMCLESRNLDGTGNRVHKRLPIDLSTFLNIDARHMNRNLACLTGLHPEESFATLSRGGQCATSHQPPGNDRACDSFLEDAYILGRPLEFLRKPRRRSQLISGFLFCILCLAGFLSSYRAYNSLDGVFSGNTAEDTYQGPSSLSRVSSAKKATITTDLSTGNRQKSQRPVTRTDGPLSSSLVPPTTSTDLANRLSDQSLTVTNESDMFKMQVIGESYVILRPPHRYTLLKKAPTLHVKVLRSGTRLEAQLLKLFDGVYALELGSENAYGPLEVTVWTKAKPRLSQTFEIDLGNPWLKLAGWKKASHIVSTELLRDFSIAQCGLQSALRYSQQQLQSSLSRAFEKMNGSSSGLYRLEPFLPGLGSGISLPEVRHLLGTRWEYQVVNSTSHILDHAQGLSLRFLRKATEICRSAISEDTARYVKSLPTRASRTFTMDRAQKQARRLWTKVIEKRPEEPVPQFGRAECSSRRRPGKWCKKR